MYVSSDVLLVALVPRKPTNRQSVAKKPHFVHRETQNQPAIRRPCADRCKISASIAARAWESTTAPPDGLATASGPLQPLSSQRSQAWSESRSRRLPAKGAAKRHPPPGPRAIVPAASDPSPVRPAPARPHCPPP